MTKPLVSVVTVCRNCLDDLLKTAASVHAQSISDYEFVVVDGASSDATPLRLADGSVGADRYVSESDNGIFDAMNKGARLASGEWVIYMNAGDTFASPDTLAVIAPFLRDNTDDIVYGDALLDRGGELKRKCGMTPANRHRMYFHHQAAFVRRNLQLDIPYRTDTGLSGDFCFFKEAWIAGRRFRHVDVDVCVYDCNGISSRNRLRVIRDNIAVVRRFDSLPDMMRFLPRLYFVVVWDKLRHLL